MSVAESSPPDTIVGVVRATDADDDAVPVGQVGANLRYRITRGDPGSFFKIDPESGA